jgi:sarcosine oxidase/L-pipecolate oxidase
VIALNKGTPNEGTVYELKDSAEIKNCVRTGGTNGNWGYINRRSGWADAEASMIWLRQQVEATKRVTFLVGTVSSLLYTSDTSVEGVTLSDNTTLKADLTILATGAWTPTLVDLRGRCQATGQVLSYLDITDAEQASLEKMPVFLKVARHGYGYTNPRRLPIPCPSPSPSEVPISCPRTVLDDPALWIPHEGETACRRALREMIPSLGDRPFTHTKICWYTDTPTGDFLFDYHPTLSNLFLATGGSGHGFKFLPVIGDKIVGCMKGQCPEDFKEKWAWRKEPVENVVTEDGSRGGRPGMILDDELQKGSRL